MNKFKIIATLNQLSYITACVFLKIKMDERHPFMPFSHKYKENGGLIGWGAESTFSVIK